MKPENSLERFQAFLTENGVELTSLTPEAGVSLALAFYQAERSDVVTRSADMLLFQWGTNDKAQYAFADLWESLYGNS